MADDAEPMAEEDGNPELESKDADGGDEAGEFSAADDTSVPPAADEN